MPHGLRNSLFGYTRGMDVPIKQNTAKIFGERTQVVRAMW
jgi:hypothetical protein